MNLKLINDFIAGVSEDERRKASQFLKNSTVVYCYAEKSGAIVGAFRNLQATLGKKIVKARLLPIASGNISALCDICEKNTAIPCVHSVALAMHCLKFESLFVERKERHERLSYSGLPPVSLDSVLERAREPESGTHLEVHFPQGLPHFPTIWNNCLFGVRLFSPAREYLGNIANIRQLHFREMIGVNLRISQFSLQEKQIIRYLAFHAAGEGNLLSMNSEALAEFFHCLAGFASIFSGEKTIHVNREFAEPGIAFYMKGGRRMFRPALVIGEDRIVTAKNFYIIMGRNGCWIGTNGDYWWLPAVIDIAVLRAFFRLEETALESKEAEELLPQFPSRFFKLVDQDAKAIHKRRFTPVFHIHMPNNGESLLSLALYFDYKGTILKPGAENIYSDSKQSFRRDKELETLLLDELAFFGFVRKSSESNEFFLSDIDSAGVFMSEVVPTWIAAGRKVFFEAGSNQIVPELKLALFMDFRDGLTVKFRYSISAPDGKSLKWQKLVKDCLELEDFTVAHESAPIVRIPSSIKEFIFSVWDLVRVEDSSIPEKLSIPTAALEYFLDCCRKHGIVVENMPDLSKTEDALEAEDFSPGKFFKGTLRPYQLEALKWMAQMFSKGFNFILADEMGLGKTVQALALLSYLAEKRASGLPSMVLCPSSLVENWKLEAERFVPEMKSIIIRGNNRDSSFWEHAASHNLIICSYAIIRRDVELCSNIKFDCLILDEAQHIKNPNTENAKTCKSLNSISRMILTGTPIENSALDIWSLFDFLHPGLLGTHRTFKAKFCGPNADAATQQELAARTGPFILRRRKAEVAAELPEKTEQTIFCDFDEAQKKIYDIILDQGRGEFESIIKNKNAGRIHVLTALLRLRQICCHPLLLPEKIRPVEAKSAKMELFRELLFESIDSGHRILFFSQFTSLLKIVRDMLEAEKIQYEYLDGATENRIERVHNFNSNPQIPIFLLSLKAGGTGLNLVGADKVIIYDPWWNPAVENQASDRAHRIGQTKKVSVVKLAVKNSIEERVMALHDKKQELFDNVVENASLFRKMSDDDIRFLLGL